MTDILFTYEPRNSSETDWIFHVRSMEHLLTPIMHKVIGMILEDPSKWEMGQTEHIGPEETGCFLGMEAKDILETIFQEFKYKVNQAGLIVGHASRDWCGKKVPTPGRDKMREIWSRIQAHCEQDRFGPTLNQEMAPDVFSIVAYMPNTTTYLRPPRISRLHKQGTVSWDYVGYGWGTDAVHYTMTATHAGYVTSPHHDCAIGTCYIWHVVGAKLWLIWEDVSGNAALMKAARERGDIERNVTLEWAFDNLKGLKIYFAKASNHPRWLCRFFVPLGAVHAVVSLQTSVHFGSYLLQTSRIDDVKAFCDSILADNEDPTIDSPAYADDLLDIQYAKYGWKEFYEWKEMEPSDEIRAWLQM